MKRLLSVLPILAALFLCYACSEKKEPDEGKDDTDTTVIVDDTWGGTDPGSIYLGITGFNESLYTYPIKKLTSESRSGFNSFIDGLSTKGATILCWAMDQSLDAFQKSRFPSDLSTAAVVTFTDGRDQGSMGYTDRYSTRNAYLNALQDRLQGSISGVSITAYSIGLRGTDVRDTEVEDFKNDLARLASPDDPVTGEKYSFFVENMEDVNKRFQEIAAKLSRSYNVQSVTLRIPVPGDGTLVRFTFDNVTDAENSTLYIEGCYNKDDVKLEDLSLEGMSSPWSSVKGVKSGPYVTFTFSILRNTGVTLSLSNVREWLLEPEEAAWKENSEFRPDDISNEIKEEVHSAAVMLLLDCSSSLGSDFDVMRLQARSFINTLLRGSDPTAVMSVSLNKPTLTLETGHTETLIATVLPTTASNKNVTWSSDKIAIATVDSKGMVKGVSPGVATIKATTVDGGHEASCTVTVVNNIVDVNSVTVSPSTLMLKEGETSTLTATVNPSNSTDRTVIWSSTNESAAKVDQTGKVTAVKEGTATIIATCGGKSGPCTVTVKKESTFEAQIVWQTLLSNTFFVGDGANASAAMFGNQLLVCDGKTVHTVNPATGAISGDLNTGDLPVQCIANDDAGNVLFANLGVYNDFFHVYAVKAGSSFVPANAVHLINFFNNAWSGSTGIDKVAARGNVFDNGIVTAMYGGVRSYGGMSFCLYWTITNGKAAESYLDSSNPIENKPDKGWAFYTPEVGDLWRSNRAAFVAAGPSASDGFFYGGYDGLYNVNYYNGSEWSIAIGNVGDSNGGPQGMHATVWDGKNILIVAQMGYVRWSEGGGVDGFLWVTDVTNPANVQILGKSVYGSPEGQMISGDTENSSVDVLPVVDGTDLVVYFVDTSHGFLAKIRFPKL